MPTPIVERQGSSSAAPLPFLSGPKVKVLYVDHTAAISGGEVALLNLLRYIDRRRYDVRVLLLSEGPLVARLKAIGVQTDVLLMPSEVGQARKEELGFRSLLKWRQIAEVLKQIWLVAQYCRQWQPDIVHTNSLKSDIIGGLAARAIRIPAVWHVRDRIDSDYLPAKVATVFRWLAAIIPTRVITISSCTRESLINGNRKLAHKLDVVNDGVDLELFRSTPDVGFSKNSGLKIAIIGRISPWKGQDIFIDAAALLHRQFPEARFLIAGSALFGESDYENKIRAMVEELQMQSSVEFLGFVEDIPALLCSVDVVVHASTTGEPFGQVVTEAMAAGKPVIATNGGAIPEIIEDGVSGIIVPMKDSAALAEALRIALSGGDLRARLGAGARKRVEQCFSVEKTAQGVMDVYEGLFPAASDRAQTRSPAEMEHTSQRD